MKTRSHFAMESSSLIRVFSALKLLPISPECRIFTSETLQFQTQDLLFWHRRKSREVKMTLLSPVNLMMLGPRVWCRVTRGDHVFQSELLYPERTSRDTEFQYFFTFPDLLPLVIASKTLLIIEFGIQLPGENSMIISEKHPLVLYNHAKYKPWCQCSLLWFGYDGLSTSSPSSVGDLMVKMALYYNTILGEPGAPKWMIEYLLRRLGYPKENTLITFDCFYQDLGEWFVVALETVAEHKELLWVHRQTSYIPLLIGEYEAKVLLAATGGTPQDFLVRVCPTLAPKSRTGERPRLSTPFIITYLDWTGQYQNVTLRNYEIYRGFFRTLNFLQNYVLFTHDGRYQKIPKKGFF